MSRNGTRLDALGFVNVDLGGPLDFKVTPSGGYVGGTQDFGTGLVEFTADGVTAGQFAPGDYESVAVLPGGVVWSGFNNGGPGINVFNTLFGPCYHPRAYQHSEKH